MSRLFDRAQVLEQRQRDHAIAAARAQAPSSGPSLTHCEDCDSEIPEGRRATGGKTRCVPCQSAFEKGGQR